MANREKIESRIREIDAHLFEIECGNDFASTTRTTRALVLSLRGEKDELRRKLESG